MISFFVPGLCKTAGSKRGFFIPKINRVVITDANKDSKGWKQQVALFAQQAILEQKLSEPMRGPLAAEFIFIMPRIGSHYGSGRNAGVLKDNAPSYHEKKPDGLKLARAVEDALTGIVYVDDSQIAEERFSKVYGPMPGVKVRIRQLTQDDLPRATDDDSEPAPLFEAVNA